MAIDHAAHRTAKHRIGSPNFVNPRKPIVGRASRGINAGCRFAILEHNSQDLTGDPYRPPLVGSIATTRLLAREMHIMTTAYRVCLVLVPLICLAGALARADDATRLKRDNPLHLVKEIWPDLKQDIHEGFVSVFPVIQSNVADWRKRRSITTGS